ncbi:MAG: DEAD/DEAH box helicase [bacterium]
MFNLNEENFPYGDENLHRLQKQIDIVNNCGKSTIIKAPAGFGKTLIGMIWLSKDNRKTIIVCPRNVVAKSNYRSIISELKAFGIDNVKVELFLTGEVVEKNHNDDGEFNSDIIITNIDNFESPTYKDNISSRLFTIMSANVIFDEYHEFVSGLPLFGNFVNIMRARHRYCDSKTMLLSATPVDINYFWDGDEDNKTVILPDENNHYSASHDSKYIIRVTDDYNYDVKGSDITICNSISEAQFIKHKINAKTLFHSELTSEKRASVYDYIMDNYDKFSDQFENKESVVSSLITQASLDVSFHKLYESVLSPETSLQRLGRCNRFNSFIEKSIYTIFKLKDRNGRNCYSQSEKSVLENFYTQELSDAWYDEMKAYDGQELTLDEIYKIYNNHVKKYSRKRKALFNKMFLGSLTYLTNLYPYKFTTEKDDDVISAGSNKLRSVGSETFFIVRLHGSDDQYVGPFTTSIYHSYENDFNEDGSTLHRMKQAIKAIVNSGDDRFDYQELTKTKKRFERLSLDGLRKYGKKSNTPYIRFDKVYHPEYGVISENLLNMIQSI